MSVVKKIEKKMDVAKSAKTGLAKNPVDLDSILDQALEDFETDRLNAETKRIEKKQENHDDANDVDRRTRQREDDEARIAALLSNMDDPRYGATLQSTLMSLSQTAEGNQTVDELLENIQKQRKKGPTSTGFLPTSDNDEAGIAKADDVAAATLQMLGAAQMGMEGFEASKMEEVGEQMMEEMMAEFEALGEKEDYSDAVDNIMKQLLSRDLMYAPTKQICDKFPEWLALHKANLTESDYNDYGLQYQAFQRLLATYDSEPDNFPRLMEIMFDIQKYGQPPADIIRDLAPGLKFDENGMPIMPNMGVGMTPDMPGGEGPLPDLGDLSQKMATGQCCVM